MLTHQKAEQLFHSAHLLEHVESRRVSVENQNSLAFGAFALVLDKDYQYRKTIQSICFGGLVDAIYGAGLTNKKAYVLAVTPTRVNHIGEKGVHAFYKWLENDSPFAHLITMIEGNQYALVEASTAPEVEVRGALILLRAMTEMIDEERTVYSDVYRATGNVPFSLILGHSLRDKKTIGLVPKRSGHSHLLISPSKSTAHGLCRSFFDGKRMDLSKVGERSIHTARAGRMDGISTVGLICRDDKEGLIMSPLSVSLAGNMEKAADVRRVKDPFGYIRDVHTFPSLKDAAKFLVTYLSSEYKGPAITWEGEKL